VLEASVQLLGWDAKRVHLFVRIARGGTIVATLEQVLVHVDRPAGCSAPVPERVAARLAAAMKAQSDLPRPVEAGRAIRFDPR
jgi:acyl-CoA thioesterase FadM